MKRAVYAGSFDPITNGHIWVIKRGIELFDELVVAVGINPEKKYTFSLEERLATIKELLVKHPNARVASFENKFLVRYAKEVNAQYILRGVRSSRDYEYEREMRNINADLDPDITTIVLIPPRKISEVSSSFVKGLIGPEGWEFVVQKYVPDLVFQQLRRRHNDRQK